MRPTEETAGYRPVSGLAVAALTLASPPGAGPVPVAASTGALKAVTAAVPTAHVGGNAFWPPTGY